MFFRRKEKKPAPNKDEDGFYYAEDGEAYDSDEFETDSECSHDSKDDNISDKEEEDEDEHLVHGGKEEVKLKDGDEETLDAKMNPSEDVAVSDVIANDDNDCGDDNNEECDSGEGELVKWPSSSDESFEQVKIPKDTNTSHVDVKGGQLELEMDQEDCDDYDESRQNIELESSNLNDRSSQNIGSVSTGTQQPLPSSLDDDRSLLAIAAEQDRVDVIKAILQPNANGNTNSTARAQLLLNNTLVENNDQFSENDLENVFLPPLHIAIASSSTNAASCFLRMGSNPAIRQSIPEDWSGPGWKDEKGEDFFSEDKWKVIHGKTAWEVAFGPMKKKEEVESKTEEKRGWFGFGKSTDKKTTEDDFRVNIEPSKLEGIKHAFTAEALRAIGSDEVDRLKELLDSGLGTSERIEIGGKDLFGWCREMNASKCIDMIKTTYAAVSPTSDKDDTDGAKEKEDGNNIHSAAEGESTNVTETEDNDDGLTYDAPTLLQLRNQFEESESLATAMSNILDNLAEEVSVTQGLLMQHGDPTNNALLSQVRALKQKRAEIEDETSVWEYKIADRSAELDMVMVWWQKRGGAASDIPLDIDLANAQGNSLSDLEQLTDQGMKAAVKEVAAQINLSENKVKKLRASITDLSEENNRNMEKVEELGLAGAVNLTRKLKEEVREIRDELDRAIQQESEMSARVQMIRYLLEEDEVLRNSDSTRTREITQPSKVEIDRSVPRETQTIDPETLLEDLIESYQPESPILHAMNDPNQLHDSSNEESFKNSSDDSESYYSGDSYEGYESYESDDELPHSERIKQGRTSAIVAWADDEDLGVFAFKVWDLLTRIFGLSKSAIKQTAKSTVEDVVKLPRVMII